MANASVRRVRHIVLLAAALVAGFGTPIVGGGVRQASAEAATAVVPAIPAAAFRVAQAGALARGLVAAARPVTTAGPPHGSYRHGLATTVGSSKAAVAPPRPAAPAARPSANSTQGDLPPVNRNLMYYGGNNGVSVITGAPKVYLVFWGSQWGAPSTDVHGYVTLDGDPLGMAPDLQAFMKGLGTGGETWSGILTQYCEELIAGSQTCPASAAAHAGYPYGGALAGVWADTATPAPQTANAHELAAEAIAGATHFGNTTQAANRDAQYVVVSATGATPDGFNTPDGDFCAWHDWTGDTTLPGGGAAVSPFAVAFTNLPYIPDAGGGCGENYVNSGNAGTLDGVTIVGGHEYAETVTDQFPAGGWLDTSSSEIADKCAWIGAAPSWVRSQNITLTTGTFPVQSIWSNDSDTGFGDCVLSHPIVPNVDVAPTLTSENSYVFTVGAPGTFRVMATGFPVPALTEAGPLPQGITFVDNGDGSALVQGTAVAGQGGYPLTVTAADGRGGHVTQAFTLTVNEHRAGTIVNFAGVRGGARGNTGDGGPGTEATLMSPFAAAVDGAGTVYIADANNDRIRTVDGTGTIANFAGNPFGGYGNDGDGGPAAFATLGSPTGVAVDRAGNVYIADSLNNRVRKVDRAGIINNLAGSPTGEYGNTGDGGPATSALLGYTAALAVDSAGNVYIAQGPRVRKVSPAGIITNFAGSPDGVPGHSGDGGPAVDALLSDARGLAVDGAGNVYITESAWVRKVDPAGIITTFAGGGASPGIGDGGPATSASLVSAWGIVADHAGNIFIGDLGDQRVRMVDTNGTITTVAGNPAGTYGDTGDGGPATAAAFEYLFGLAVDGADNVFVVDYKRVREILGAPPAISSAAATTFTVGLAGSFTVAASAFPPPHLTETGPLPPGLSFDPGTGLLSGTPAQGSAGSYRVRFDAANGAGPTASQAFTVTVDQATLTYPTDGQVNASTTRPFTWSTIPQAQGYILTVGLHPSGTDLVNTGVLPGTQSSYAVPALPAGRTLYATLYAGINGVWTSYQVSSFTVASGLAAFTFPLDRQAGADPTRAFTWAPVAGAQGYLLVVGTTHFGTNLVNSGVLAPSQSFFTTPVLPAGQTLYATLLTEVNGAFTRYQAITFTTGPAMGTLTHPVNSQLQVATPTDVTWSTVAGAQNYFLVIGTARYGSDLVSSGVLAPSRSSWHVAALPRGKLLHATLLTRLNGTWVFHEAIFTTSP